MSNDPTIIISTEEVKVSELNKREKQIYKYAFDLGAASYKEASKEEVRAGKWLGNVLTITGLAVWILFIIFRNLK